MALRIVRRLSRMVIVPGFQRTRQVNSGRVACACRQSIIGLLSSGVIRSKANGAAVAALQRLLAGLVDRTHDRMHGSKEPASSVPAIFVPTPE